MWYQSTGRCAEAISEMEVERLWSSAIDERTMRMDHSW
jgi:hypothetical protein